MVARPVSCAPPGCSLYMSAHVLTHDDAPYNVISFPQFVHMPRYCTACEHSSSISQISILFTISSLSKTIRTADIRLCQHISFPHPPCLYDAFKCTREMCYEFLLHLLFFIAIPLAHLHRGRVRVHEQILIETYGLSSSDLDLDDGDGVVQVGRK